MRTLRNTQQIAKHKEQLKQRHRDLGKSKHVIVDLPPVSPMPIQTLFHHDPPVKPVAVEKEELITYSLFPTHQNMYLPTGDSSLISCIHAVQDLLYVGTTAGTLTLYRVSQGFSNHRYHFSYTRLKKYRLEDVDGITFVTKILTDPKCDLLFFTDSQQDKIYILGMTTLEIKNGYQDLMERYPYFKSGVINLQKKIVQFCLDTERGVVAFQTADKMVYGYSYAKREHANRLVQTPFMESVFEHQLKEICTTLFLCQDILMVHFEQSTQLHVYSLKRRRKSKISTKGEDNKPIWNQIADVPQIIYLHNVGLTKSLCVFKNLEDVEMIYLDGTDGAISQFTKPYRDVHFSRDPKCKEMALCYPYVAAIVEASEGETVVEFRNLLHFDEKMKTSEFANPPTISNYKNLSLITGTEDRVYVADDQNVYPILVSTSWSQQKKFYEGNSLTEQLGAIDSMRVLYTKQILEQKRFHAMNLYNNEKYMDALNILYDILVELVQFKEQRDDKVKRSFIIEDMQEIVACWDEWDKIIDLQKRISVNHLNECIFCCYGTNFSWNARMVVNFLKETCSAEILKQYLAYMLENDKVVNPYYHNLYCETLISVCCQNPENQNLRAELINHIENSQYYDREMILQKLSKHDFSYEVSFVQALIDQSILEPNSTPLDDVVDEIVDGDSGDDSPKPTPTITVFNELEQSIPEEKKPGRGSKLMKLMKSFGRKNQLPVKQEVKDDDVQSMTDDEFNHIMEMFLTEQGIMNDKSRQQFHSLPKSKKVVIYENWREEKKKTRDRRPTIVDVKYVEAAPLPKIKESAFIKEYDQFLNENKIHDEKVRQILYMLSLDKKISLLEQHKREKKLEEKKRLEDEKKRKHDEKVQHKEDLMSDEEINKKMAVVADKLGVQGDARKKFLDLPRDQKLVIIKQHKLLLTIAPAPRIEETPKQDVLIDRDYTGYTVNFNSVFSVTSMREAFRKHLKLESNSEPFEFLLELSRLHKHPSKEVVEKFNWLCEEFIVTKAPREINIFGGDKQRVLKIRADYLRTREWTSKESPLETLEKIRKTLYNDLRLDTFPRFISSKLGYECILQNVANPNVISKDPLYGVMYKMKGSQYDDKSLEKETEMMEKAYSYCNSHKFKELLSWKWVDEIPDEKRSKTVVAIKILLIPEPEEKQVKTEGFKSLFKSFATLDSDQDISQYYYSALQIGPNWIFEWNDSDLCTPRVFNPKDEIIQFEIETTFKVSDLLANMHDFLETIVEWNSRKKFNPEGGDKKKFGNSQDFVEALLRSLGVKMILPFYSPCHEEMVKRIKEKGATKVFFTTTPDFRQIFFLKKKEISVKTHEIFDEFVASLIAIDKNLDVDFPGEWAWLKSVDKMFWIKYKNLTEETTEAPPMETKDPKLKRKSLKALLEVAPSATKDTTKLKDRVKPHENCPFKDWHQ